MSDEFVPVSWLIEHTKIAQYLLNPNHPKGGSKARYLLAFGFTTKDPELLATSMVKHAMAHLPGVTMIPQKGPRRVIFEGSIEGPDDRMMSLRTVWEFTTPTELRLITVVPLTK